MITIRLRLDYYFKERLGLDWVIKDRCTKCYFVKLSLNEVPITRMLKFCLESLSKPICQQYGSRELYVKLDLQYQHAVDNKKFTDKFSFHNCLQYDTQGLAEVSSISCSAEFRGTGKAYNIHILIPEQFK